jgi:subtilisin
VSASSAVVQGHAGLSAALRGLTGRGVRVGVIDSGWDRSLPDPRVLPGLGLVPGDPGQAPAWTDDDGDRNGHGTACAHLVLRVAPDARVIPLRIFGERLETGAEALAAAIHRGAEMGLDVLNVSMGTLSIAGLQPLYRACAHALEAGTIVVAATNARLGWSVPAIFANAIGVGALPGRGGFAIAHRPDDAVECLAHAEHPGVPWLGGEPRTVRGTSFAAPVVSGIVALLREREPGAPLARMHELLAEVASPAPVSMAEPAMR